jgi:hypothetical protein
MQLSVIDLSRLLSIRVTIGKDVAPDDFEILGSLRNIEVIASGRGVRTRRRLHRRHGGSRWRKMKGVALVREYNGDIYEAEIHWFEAHGVGKRDWKIKKRLA